MAQLNKKISASTLVEVLVAMLIIMIVFAIASKIYLNSFLQVPSYTKLRVEQELENQLQQIQTGEMIPMEDVIIDGVIYQSLISDSQFEGLKVIEIKALQEEKVVSKIKGLAVIPHTNEED